MIEKEFAYRGPTESNLKAISNLRETYSILLREIRQLCPKSRESSLAVTSLEESAMWAMKAITHAPEIPEVPKV